MAALITIEPIAMRHAEAVQRFASDPDILAMADLPDPYPEDGARTWIREARKRRKNGEQYAFAIIHGNEARENQVVGVVSVLSSDDPIPESKTEGQAWKLGYWVGKPYWGRGYATAAGKQILRFAFATLDIDYVRALTLRRNSASRRVLEKLGFELEVVEEPEAAGSAGDSHDTCAHYMLLRSTWMKRVGRENLNSRIN